MKLFLLKQMNPKFVGSKHLGGNAYEVPEPECLRLVQTTKWSDDPKDYVAPQEAQPPAPDQGEDPAPEPEPAVEPEPAPEQPTEVPDDEEGAADAETEVAPADDPEPTEPDEAPADPVGVCLVLADDDEDIDDKS